MNKITQLSAQNILPKLALDPAKWNRIPSEDDIAQTVKSIEARGVQVIRVQNGIQALSKIRELIPPGSEVMNGSSTTLIEIGYRDFLESGTHNWMNLHKIITAENDASKRNEIRRKSITAEYFLSGVNAIAMTGELVSCDASGSRVGAWPFGASHLILVAGVNKIVPTLSDALQRIKDYVYPLENARSKIVNGVPSLMGKFVILAGERQTGRIILILVDDNFGY
jgi:hypothetical protein